MKKLPQITLAFWIMKICATTLGETGGDLFSMTLKIGYALSSLLLIGMFVVALTSQLRSKKYHPFLYWTVILATSTAGTTMSDFMDRTLKLGYARGTFILLTILLAIFTFWRLSGASFSVKNITTLRVEILYWTAILFSNTLGTAMGDFLADSSGLGFGGGALLIGSLIGLVILAMVFTPISKTLLFWIAFVLTRPFGATMGDFLTKTNGGLGFGTIGSSLVLVSILIFFILLTGSSLATGEANAPANFFEQNWQLLSQRILLISRFGRANERMVSPHEMPLSEEYPYPLTIAEDAHPDMIKKFERKRRVHVLGKGHGWLTYIGKDRLGVILDGLSSHSEHLFHHVHLAQED